MLSRAERVLNQQNDRASYNATRHPTEDTDYRAICLVADVCSLENIHPILKLFDIRLSLGNAAVLRLSLDSPEQVLLEEIAVVLYFADVRCDARHLVTYLIQPSNKLLIQRLLLAE